MRKQLSCNCIRRNGFSLIELVVVMVIIGILAAVAVPKFTNTSSQAYLAKQQATLGALKAAWSNVYATTKAAPTCTAVAAQMADPTCTFSSTSIKCTGVTQKDGTGQAAFGCTDAGIASSPAGITCDAVNGC